MSAAAAEDAQPARFDARWAFVWALPLAVGLWLRSVGLRDQVLVGDERWEIAAALTRSLPEIFGSFVISRAAYSPPIAAIHRLLLESGFEPSELSLRAPIWLCGALLLAGLPWWLRRRVEPGVLYTFCWLLALSPLLVFYSRIARGYLPEVLLCALTTLCALRFIESGSRRAALGFALASGLAVNIHLLALPFVGAALSYAGLRLLFAPGRDGFTLRDWLALCLATALCVSLCVAPAWSSIVWMLSSKGGEGRLDAVALFASMARLVGLGPSPLALIVWGFAGLGVWRLHAREPRLAELAGLQVVVQAVAVFVLGPAGAESDVIYTRYVLVVVPWLVLFVAVGIAPVSTHGRRWLWAEGMLAAAVLVVSFASGPLSRPLFLQGSFAHAWAFRSWAEMRQMNPALESERFYTTLREPERSGVVIETLWHGVVFPDTAPAYQRVHGQPVIVASLIDAWWDDPRLALHTALRPDGLRSETLLASRGRWVVVHLDPQEEALAIAGRDGAWARRRLPRLYHDFAAREVELCRKLSQQLRRTLGPPDYADRWIEAWDLDRIRAGSADLSSQ